MLLRALDRLIFNQAPLVVLFNGFSFLSTGFCQSRLACSHHQWFRRQRHLAFADGESGWDEVGWIAGCCVICSYRFT